MSLGSKPATITANGCPPRKRITLLDIVLVNLETTMANLLSLLAFGQPSEMHVEANKSWTSAMSEMETLRALKRKRISFHGNLREGATQ